jgi:hypothetical protein
MIDMLLHFEDLEGAIGALSPYGLVIDGKIDQNQVRPTTVTFAHGHAGDGLWLLYTLPYRVPELESLCTLVLSRNLGGEMLSDYVLTSPYTDDWVDSIAAIEPAWSGSSYPYLGV